MSQLLVANGVTGGGVNTGGDGDPGGGDAGGGGGDSSGRDGPNGDGRSDDGGEGHLVPWQMVFSTQVRDAAPVSWHGDARVLVVFCHASTRVLPYYH